jgi:hypothetical protein
MAGKFHVASGAPDVTAAGPDARPFNALHRDFIARHERRSAGNNRMAMPLRTMRRMEPGKPAGLRALPGLGSCIGERFRGPCGGYAAAGAKR